MLPNKKDPNIAYLLYRVLEHISENSNLPCLTHPHRSCDGLLLYRRIPLRLDDMNSISNSQVQSIDCQLYVPNRRVWSNLPYGAGLDGHKQHLHARVFLEGHQTIRPIRVARVTIHLEVVNAGMGQ